MVVSTSEIGATASAATCRPQAPTAIPKPIVHHRERNKAAPLRSGWLSRTAGAATAPRYLQSIATLVARAQASASNVPS